MVDSANERIADLYRGVAEARAAADEARAAADEAEEELAALRCGDADRQDGLRCGRGGTVACPDWWAPAERCRCLLVWAGYAPAP